MKKEPKRCEWANASRPFYLAYHDKEWGVPVRDDRTQFEFLILEGAQAGLSWSTILNKREAYRRAFAGFDPAKVARFDTRKIASLLKDAGIVRNHLKIEAAVNNARRFLEVQKEFGSFCDYIWSFVGGSQKVNRWTRSSQIPATSPESDALSADLKKRGFKFVGSTIIYAHMQATGLVNDPPGKLLPPQSLRQSRTRVSYDPENVNRPGFSVTVPRAAAFSRTPRRRWQP